jgi:hypothetical protein
MTKAPQQKHISLPIKEHFLSEEIEDQQKQQHSPTNKALMCHIIATTIFILQ